MPPYKDPWAEAGNKAIGGLFKAFMSRPNQGVMEAQALQNELARSNLRSNDLAYETGRFNQDQARSAADVYKNFGQDVQGVPQIGTEMPVAEGTYGPNQAATAVDQNSAMSDVFTNYIGRGLDPVQMGGERDLLGTANALRFENPIRRQLALDEKATSYDAYTPGGSSGGTRAAKIADLIRLHGVDEQQAVSITDNVYKYATDNISSMRTQFDPTSNDLNVLEPNVVPINQSGGFPAPVETTPRDLNFDPGNATGIMATGKNLVNRTIGQFLPGFVSQGPERDAQKIRVLERDLIKALASSSRPPVVEQERITSMLSEPFKWFENPEIANEKVAGVVDLMMQQYNVDQTVAADIMMPAKEKTDAIRRMNEIKRTLSSIVSPDHIETLFPSGDVGGSLTPEEQEELRMLEAMEAQ